MMLRNYNEQSLVDSIEQLARNHIEDDEYVSFLYVLGEPTGYNSEIPREWQGAGGKTIGNFADTHIIRFQPREVERDGDSIVLRDGLLGMYPEYADEFDDHVEHTIETEEYAVAVAVHHTPDPNEEWVVQKFTSGTMGGGD